jgi:hypothetical protein
VIRHGSQTILPTITIARLRWLAELEEKGVARRRSHVGYHTMRLGWTEWIYSDGAETIGEDEFDRRYPVGEPPAGTNPKELARAHATWAARMEALKTWRIVGEALTQAGAKILAEHRDEWIRA